MIFYDWGWFGSVCSNSGEQWVGKPSDQQRLMTMMCDPSTKDPQRIQRILNPIIKETIMRTAAFPLLKMTAIMIEQQDTGDCRALQNCTIFSMIRVMKVSNPFD